LLDLVMDFFDDPNLFVGGLEGLEEDTFPPGPSIVDELNLTAEFESIQANPLSQQHGQYHNTTMSQITHTNGLFSNGSSPMWGNQDQNANIYQHQQPVCHQQLHNQQMHVRHQTQPHLHHLPPPQQQCMGQQLLNHGHHQHHMSASNTQHHAFSYQRECPPQNQQQFHQSQHNLAIGDPRHLSKSLPQKSYLDCKNAPVSRPCLQQSQNNYQMMAGAGENNMGFSVHSSSMVHPMSNHVTSANSYPSAPYPSYPGEPEVPCLSQQSSLSRPSMQNSSGPVCPFSTSTIDQHNMRTTVSQAEEYDFRSTGNSASSQGNHKQEMFGDSASCYPTMVNHSSFDPRQSFGVANTNGYQVNLQQTDAHSGVLEAHDDLLPDILPQLEEAFIQQEESSCSWSESIQEMGQDSKAPPVEYPETKVMNALSVTFLTT
uniref:Uncharacterized protein n=1 Tax=Periophthalmus magnuspinnatus TaxID=409849 RepID=A0A3B4BES7_9GOBI